MSKNKVAMILGIMCFILVLAICIQIKTIDKATEIVGSTIKDNSGLKDELLSSQGTYQTLYKDLENAEATLENKRTQAASKNQNDIQSEAEVKLNEKLLGITEVKGSGIIIKLDDNRKIDENEKTANLNGYLVHEGDLLRLINELYNAGADAISINNQRIVNTTAILCDGNILRINGEMIGVPIEIKAIGYPEILYYNALTRPGSYLQTMANDGVNVYIEKNENITIPKYEGVYSYEYIERGDV